MAEVRRTRTRPAAPAVEEAVAKVAKAKRGGKARPEAAEEGPAELGSTLNAMRKRYGEHIVTLANEVTQPDRISTGIFLLDFALLGGIPHNRVTHVVGERSAGKSTLSDKITVGAQQQFPDSTVVKIDVEGTHDTVWSSKLGVDPDRLYVAKPETGEAAVDMADALASSKEVSLVIVDSIAALAPMKEQENSAEDATVGLQARLVGIMIRKLTSAMLRERGRDHFVTILLINQFRSKIGGYGDPRAVPGGKALEFAATVQLIMKNKEKSGKDAYDVEGIVENEHSFYIQKNKMNGGLREGEFRLRRIPDPELGLNEGDIDDAATMLLYGKKFGIYNGAGSSWTLEFNEDSHKFRGLNEAVATLYEDQDLRWRLRNYLIREQAAHLGMPDEFLARFE